MVRHAASRRAHTLYVLLWIVVGMAAYYERLVELNDEEEALQRGLHPPMIGGSANASVLNDGATALVRIASAEVAQPALGGAVEFHSGGMPSEQLRSIASYAETRDAAMALGAATELRPPLNGAEIAIPPVQNGVAISPSGVMLPSGHEAEAFMRTAKKQRRKEKLKCQWYCGYCRHYTPKMEARCVNCRTAKANVAGHDQAALLRLQSRKSRKKGRQQNSVGAGSAIDR